MHTRVIFLSALAGKLPTMDAIRFARSPEETRARFSQARTEVEQAAQQLTPEDVLTRGEYLGAGLAGGSYAVQVGGKTFVAKQLGHEKSSLGGLGVWSETEKNLQAQKQVAVQNALAMAGFPLPASALMAGAPDWVVMEKVDGTGIEKVPAPAQATLREQTSVLSEQMEPIIGGVISDLKAQNPEHQHLYRVAMDLDGNTLYTRQNDGWVVSGVYDPVI